jgi:two-component system response regulator
MDRDPVILLVEDDPDDEELTLLALRGRRIRNEVDVVRDGAEALEYLFCEGRHAGRDPEEMPQLVLLDLNLPRMGGLDVLRALRADPRTTHLPVVVFTSSAQESDLVASYRLGANSYVQKPLDKLDFSEALRSLNVYWILVNEPAPGARGAPDG